MLGTLAAAARFATFGHGTFKAESCLDLFGKQLRKALNGSSYVIGDGLRVEREAAVIPWKYQGAEQLNDFLQCGYGWQLDCWAV